MILPEELIFVAVAQRINRELVSAPVQDILKAERERIARWAERRAMPNLAFNLRMMDGDE
jgi:hypothetical protein